MSILKEPLLRVVSFLALLLACQISPLIGTGATSGAVLFQDDFSDRASGWPRLASPVGIMDYDRGGYRMLVREPHYNLWATAGKRFDDVRLEVDTLRIGGPVENRFGLICRYHGEKNFYFFVISSDGYYGIGKMRQGSVALIGQEQMRYNEVIHRDGAINHLRADCVADTLILYVNDLPVAMARDDEFPEGEVGVMVGAFEQSGVDVLFDDFVVLKP